jgi:hypothetical protein
VPLTVAVAVADNDQVNDNDHGTERLLFENTA